MGADRECRREDGNRKNEQQDFKSCIRITSVFIILSLGMIFLQKNYFFYERFLCKG